MLDHIDDPAIGGLVVVLTPLRPIVTPTDRWTNLLAMSSELLAIIRADALTPDYISPNCEALLGYALDELIDRADDFVHADDIVALRETAASVLAEPGREDRLRIRLRDAGGRWLWFDTTFANHAEDTLIGGMLIRGRDITALVEKEEELAAAARRFEAIVTEGPGVTILIGHESTITFCSAGITGLLGYRPDELIGTKGFEIVHPDDLEFAGQQLAAIVDDETAVLDPTFRLRHADGHYEWIGITAMNRFDDPAIDAIVLSLRNRGEEMLAEERIRRLLRDASGGTFVVDVDTRISWTTPGIDRYLGGHRMLDADALKSLVADADLEEARSVYRDVIHAGDGAVRRLLCRIGPGDGKVWVDLTMTNAKADPAIRGTIVNLHEIDEAVRAGETGNRLTAVLQNTTDYVSIFDGELNLLWRNASASEVFGSAPMSQDEVLEGVPASTRRTVVREILPMLANTGSWRGELPLLVPRGGEIPLEVTILVHDSASGERFYSMMGRDITERKRLESRLEARARHDQLTGLPNRLFLSEQLEDAIVEGSPLALLFIDLDQFKAVNDSQGHDAGDRLLVTASERLRSALRPTDVVARFGGDEFVVLLTGIDDHDAALPLAERVLDHLRGPVQLGAVPVYLTGSAGIALSDGSDATTLIANADAAMYKAKADGRDRVAVFTSELRERSRDRLRTAHTLRSALDSGGLDVWFQPIVDSPSGAPIGVEALVRWQHSQLDSIRTTHVIEVAEETGLILALGAAVIERTCEAIAALGDSAGGLTFSVNLSAHQLADPLLIDALEAALTKHDVEPRRLVCEVTESAVMVDVDDSARVLDRIRDLGVGIAIDDFGTGYSSLAYLQRFPVDVLKIDREFVIGLTISSDWKRSLAAAIVSLGHSLGLRVVAESVETEEQAAILSMLGCDAMQGYLFAEATPVERLPEVLKRLRKGRRSRG